MSLSMNQRIAHLETIWVGVQLRLSCGKDPREDDDFRELLSHPPPRLVRQTNMYADAEQFNLPLDHGDHQDFDFPREPLSRVTNRHELLSDEARVRYWDARTKEGRDAVMLEEGFCPDV
jgi:hypothetical protein